MKVSVITPFYQGNTYMPHYLRVMEENRKNLQSCDELEVFLVNDSPWQEIEICQKEWIHVIQNPENMGIHGSRVHGLSCATGEYILFLDQDDELEPDAIARHMQMAKKHPDSVMVSNAMLEQADGRALWYRSAFHKKRVGDYRTYLMVGIQIISPGQCLIPRHLIPELWTRRICRTNGADDYYLWLLLLREKVPFVLLDEPLYVHKYTAKNLSADTKNMDDSTYAFLDILEEEDALPRKDIRTLRKMVAYKDAFRSGSKGTKILQSLRHPILCGANVMFKIRSKTPYGFNRG